MLAGRSPRKHRLGSVLSKPVGGSAPFAVRCVRFSPVWVHAVTGYRTKKLISVLSKQLRGSTPLPVGRVRFNPFRLVQAPATAHTRSAIPCKKFVGSA